MRPENRVGDHLPYLAHVDPHTLITRDGLLMQCIAFGGFLFETADSEEINYRKLLRDQMLQAIGDTRYAIYHHVVRRKVVPDLQGSFGDPFSARLNETWQSLLTSRQLFVNELYVTLVRRRMKGGAGWVDRLGRFLRRDRTKLQGDAALARDIQSLNSARDALIAAMGAYQPRLLGCHETCGRLYSEPLEFLATMINGETRPMLVPVGDVSNYLATRRISFGRETVEFGQTGGQARSFAAVISIKDYPAHTAPGMFDEVLRLPFEMDVTQSFGFVGRGDALGRMNLALRRMRAADDEAVVLQVELGEAKNEVAAGRATFGEHHMTLTLRGETIEEVNEGVAEALAALADLGLVAVREDIGLEPAFWAQFPGNFKYVTRSGLISSSNFAGLASIHNFPHGKASRNHWGDAVTLFETTAAGPYHFNFHKGDLGNFTIIGPSGSGKTVVLNFLLAQARKFSPRIAFFDKDRGAEIFIRATGGRYDVLRPGTPSGLNPLQMPDTPTNRYFLAEWFSKLVGECSVEELALIADVVDACYSQPIELRQLCHIAQLFRGRDRPRPDDLWSRLRPWWGDGERAWAFDNEKDRVAIEAETIGFDMTTILDDPQLRSPIMMYLFHRVEERLDGQPTIIVVDEGWKALDDEVFVGRIKDWEKTIRKRNGIIGFATQSAQDALESRISSAIIEQAATQIFMANPKARAVDYVDGFGLTEHEYNIVHTLPAEAHAFLVKHGNDSVVVRLNLRGEADILTVLSGREQSVRIFDELNETYGDDPDIWLPLLLERV